MFLAIKIDVDTDRGTKIGVPNLARLLKESNIPATFYFSLGKDHTGRALQRIFRKGFFKKVSRTSVINVYGIKTLLYGLLLPGPHIGKRHIELMRQIKSSGFEVGIHAFDHQKWQDNVNKMTLTQIRDELQLATIEFRRIFDEAAKTAAAPGWQTNAKALEVYDLMNFAYASDTRGTHPFYPKIDDHIFKTLQIPTTLPTLDELLGRPQFPTLDTITDYYLQLLSNNRPNVLTIHAELEGMKYLDWFKSFLQKLSKNNVKFATLSEIATMQIWPTCELVSSTIAGRSGDVASQDI